MTKTNPFKPPANEPSGDKNDATPYWYWYAIVVGGLILFVPRFLRPVVPVLYDVERITFWLGLGILAAVVVIRLRSPTARKEFNWVGLVLCLILGAVVGLTLSWLGV